MRDIDMGPILATQQKLLEDVELPENTSAILILALCIQELTKEVCARLDELITIERYGL